MSTTAAWLVPETACLDGPFREELRAELARAGFDVELHGEVIRSCGREVKLSAAAQCHGPIHDDPGLSSFLVVAAHTLGEDLFESTVLQEAARLAGGFVIYERDECPYWHPQTGPTGDLARILSIVCCAAQAPQGDPDDTDDDSEIEIDWSRVPTQARTSFTVVARLDGMPRASELLGCAGPSWNMAGARDTDRWRYLELFEAEGLCATVRFDRGVPKTPSYVRITFDVDPELTERTAAGLALVRDFARGYVQRLRAVGFRAIDFEAPR